jgi:hypothetical protein
MSPNPRPPTIAHLLWVRTPRGPGTDLGAARALIPQHSVAGRASEVEGAADLFRHVGRSEPSARAPIDYAWVHQELRRPGVTLQLLWLEYLEAVAARGCSARPYRYRQFCDLYASFRDKVEPSMLVVRGAGETPSPIPSEGSCAPSSAGPRHHSHPSPKTPPT